MSTFRTLYKYNGPEPLSLPASKVHELKHLSHSPLLIGFWIQPLTVTVIRVIPRSQVIDWPSCRKKSVLVNL